MDGRSALHGGAATAAPRPAPPGRAGGTRRRAAVVLLALCLSALAACGQARQAEPPAMGSAGQEDLTIGLLLPDDQTPRYEAFDRPLVEERVKQLCGGCTVEYGNAEQRVLTQLQQVNTMITKGVDVLILDPVDSRAIRSSVREAVDSGIPVVSYDRLAEGPVSAYTGFDAEHVGRIQGEALLRAMRDVDDPQVVMMNGSPTDPNAAELTRGALSVLRGHVTIGKSYDTAEWKPENAYANMSGAVAALGPAEIDGVYAANDGLAAGVISAFRAASARQLPPVTGQDAGLRAVQRIIAGDQYMTVYKPFRPEAYAAAEMALALGRGESVAETAPDRVANATAEDIPAALFTPVPVTAGNVRDTVVADGFHSVEQICTPRYAAACAEAGLIP